MDRPSDPPRADPLRAPGVVGDGFAVAGPPGDRPAPGHRPRRVEQPHSQADRRAVPRAYGPPGREEGRPDPRRRRVARPRAQLGRRPRGSGAPKPRAPRRDTSTCTRRSTGTPAWPAPSTYPRKRDHHDRVLPRQGVLRRPRHRSTRPRHHELQGHRVHQDRDRPRRPAPADPPHTPRHNGKVERYNRIVAEELLCARTWTSEAERAAAIKIWNVHYNYHRAHTAAGDRRPPPASRVRAGVTNVKARTTSATPDPDGTVRRHTGARRPDGRGAPRQLDVEHRPPAVAPDPLRASGRPWRCSARGRRPSPGCR